MSLRILLRDITVLHKKSTQARTTVNSIPLCLEQLQLVEIVIKYALDVGFTGGQDYDIKGIQYMLLRKWGSFRI